MEGASAYYNQPMQYAHDSSYSSVSGAYHSSQPACVYARNTGNGGYGGQPMSVVEQGLHGISQNAQQISHNHGIQQQALQHMNPGAGQSQMANTTPAHMQSVQSAHHPMAVPQMQLPTPPPAHQPQNTAQMSPDVDDSGLHSPQKSPNSNLQFPWMKTTKSHAAQWKAQWPGNIYIYLYSPFSFLNVISTCYLFLPNFPLKYLVKISIIYFIFKCHFVFPTRHINFKIQKSKFKIKTHSNTLLVISTHNILRKVWPTNISL